MHSNPLGIYFWKKTRDAILRNATYKCNSVIIPAEEDSMAFFRRTNFRINGFSPNNSTKPNLTLCKST